MIKPRATLAYTLSLDFHSILSRCRPVTFSLLLIITACFPALSQDLEIRARVVDSSDMEPVAFSTIYIDDFSGTISDELGFFRMQISPGKYSDTLHVSCIGYLEKDILINSLSLIKLDSIYLQPHIIELDEVAVQTKAGRAPKSRDIIRLSINKIPDNYPDKSVLFNGYYREYIKQNDDYINLFESIINLEDPGFQSFDNFTAGLMYKRINRDFRVDSQLMRPYDNRDKFVPYSVMPIPLNNELVILRAHDPVRNFNRKSLYFIECLEKDFIRNHDFSSPKLTYLDDRPYYYITFEDNRKYTIGINRISLKGAIYIDALNYGIKKLNYRATIDNGATRQKLFELSLEYKLVNDTYLLHYLSFNNLFRTRNLTLKRTRIFDDKLQLIFSKPLNSHYAGNPENFTVYLQDQEQEIEKIELEQYLMFITFSKNSPVYKKLQINLLPRNITTRKKIADNEKSLKNDLRVEFRNFKDLQGNDIADQEFNEFYQYREFFTNLIYTEHNGITSNLIVKTIPVIENKIFGEYSGDTSWLNTPLIEESVTGRKIYSGNVKLNRFIESLSVNNENGLNDIIYIHADREVYAPEDMVLFKAYIRNKKYLAESGLSKTFDILLVSSTGEIIKREKYLTTGSAVSGQLFLDPALDEGIYYIVGYSSWMKNFDTNTLFSKRIMVLKDKTDNFHLMAAFDKPEYFPGDTIQLLVNCYDDFNREVDDVSFSYNFVSGREVLQKGRGNTSFSWLDPVSLIIPPELDTIPAIEFRSAYKSQRLDTVCYLPVNHFIHMDFFPEGGYCINGLETNMAFKAVTNNGNPMEIEGEIIDQDGKVIARAGSRHDGMGVFPYRPQESRSCYFQITEPTGLNKKFLLPEGRNEGWQLLVRMDNRNINEIELEISNVNSENDTALITLMVRGYLCYYDVVKVGKKRTVKIPAEDLPQGIAVLTLFDSKLLPRAERLVYINHACNYQADMLTDRQRYIPRDSVRLSVRLSCDRPFMARGSYSLSVVDDQLCSSVMLDEPDIKSSLLLSPEIHGKIHGPNYYFDETNADAPKDLDLLLMTQGWRNYRYPGETGDTIKITRPENRDVISGHLMKQPFGTESKATDGLLTVYFGGNSTVIPVKKDGGFSFIPEYSSAINTGIVLFAEDVNGKNNLSIILDSSAFENEITAYLKYLADSIGREPVRPLANQYRFQDRFSLGIENHQWLEEVIIRKTVRKEELNIADLAFNKRKATQEEIERAVFMEDLETLVRKPNIDKVPVYYSIDGILQFRYESDGRSLPVMVPDYTYAYHILPEEIDEYTVIRGPEVQALYGYGVEYVIDVKTKPFSERGENRQWINPVIVEKFAIAKEFYKPLYDTEEKRRNTIPDLRKTIHWEPNLLFEEDGTAEVKFYNGDRYTRIKCTLEGITEEGIPVHAEHYYDVTLTREE